MASFGEELRRERELRDISIKEIAQATNIPARFLEALEQNNFGILPGGAYDRGFIRSYARHIGINVEEMVNAFHLEMERQATASQSDKKKLPAQPQETPTRSGGTAGLVGGIIVLLVASAIAFFYYWAGSAIAPAQPQLTATDAHGVALQARVKKSGALPSAAIPLQPETTGETASIAPGDAGRGGQPAPAPPVERLVRLRALETTWVQLTCAGVPQFRGDLWVGSERHIPCREPVSLSADNGGAIECSIDSSNLQLLGERGEMVKDRSLPLQRTPAQGADPPPSPKAAPVTPAVLQATGRTPQ